MTGSSIDRGFVVIVPFRLYRSIRLPREQTESPRCCNSFSASSTEFQLDANAFLQKPHWSKDSVPVYYVESGWFFSERPIVIEQLSSKLNLGCIHIEACSDRLSRSRLVQTKVLIGRKELDENKKKHSRLIIIETDTGSIKSSRSSSPQVSIAPVAIFFKNNFLILNIRFSSKQRVNWRQIHDCNTACFITLHHSQALHTPFLSESLQYLTSKLLTQTIAHLRNTWVVFSSERMMRSNRRQAVGSQPERISAYKEFRVPLGTKTASGHTLALEASQHRRGRTPKLSSSKMGRLRQNVEK
ncbi:hypothetical protein CSKR_106131 [Clonorchis sinensis]|uniref:Uncharacterized protein n=2 Tax=Clonorchis sinensis TaxID=79923 RepID=A0A8T1M1I0_CLOSI|nr:hypothetical protein CSKR_106131 [Clonorchis sinensis]GAA54366.1 hypothetical protein CLF_102527 [Clonorchis sinensis]